MTVVAESMTGVGKHILCFCQTNYCFAPVNITWYKGLSAISNLTMLTFTLDTSSDGLVRTKSSLRFTVTDNDNCQEIYCTASSIDGERVESERYRIQFFGWQLFSLSVSLSLSLSRTFFETMLIF